MGFNTCPICNKDVPEWFINAHLDECTLPIQKEQTPKKQKLDKSFDNTSIDLFQSHPKVAKIEVFFFFFSI